MPTGATWEAVDAFWATYLGCDSEAFRQSGVHVVRHNLELGDYQGAFLYRRGPACIVSVPPSRLEPVAAACELRPPGEVFDTQFLQRFFGAQVDRIIGPAWYGCADPSDFRDTGRQGVRRLEESDRAALQGLSQACDPTEWEHSDIQVGHALAFGYFLDGEIVAATRLKPRGDRLQDIGVISHPGYRGRGYGKAVVGAAARHALDEGRIAHYRTLLSNLPSMGIARALGFQGFASSIAVRLKPDPTTD